jgi:hypothetical protein
MSSDDNGQRYNLRDFTGFQEDVHNAIKTSIKVIPKIVPDYLTNEIIIV